jgi:TM2 domain-containing membrane protein YozV
MKTPARKQNSAELEPAITIARLVGPVFAAMGLSVLLNAPLYDAIVLEASHSPILIYLTGVMILPVGIAMLLAWREWTRDWRVIVTVLGWLFVIGGVIRILTPQIAMNVRIHIFTGSVAGPLIGLIVLLIGAVLTIMGYRSLYQPGRK